MDIKYTLILSGLIHLFLISPMSRTLFHSSLTLEPKVNLSEIEFEFFQAAPKEEKHLFIPKNFQDTLPLRDLALFPPQDSKIFSENNILVSPKVEPPPKFIEEELNEEPIPSEDIPLSLEDQAPIQPVEEKTSESLTSVVDLKKQEEENKTRWDYCNRVRLLVENNIQFPVTLKNQNIEDIVQIDITLNRAGKLVPGTLKITQGCASRYPEINKEALKGVSRAALFFPPIPKRYSKNEITFTLPIRFNGSLAANRE